MSVGNFSTANQTWRMLVGNGLVYTVPRFQRDYSWSDEEWDDLWRDIENTLSTDGEPAHYMGYLVLQSKDNKNFDIIDGQQRMATLSILALAVLSRLMKLVDEGNAAEDNQKRAEQLRSSFIGYLDPVTLIPRSKLTLNRNNDTLYQNYLVPLLPTPKRNLKATEHLMRKAFDWFIVKVEEGYKDGVALASFLDRLSDKLFFTVIVVSDELNAYKVFETLNARGVKLSSTDLLKNYLFSVVHRQNSDEHELNELENRWEILVGKLGSENFPDFLRTHWNSRNQFLRHAELFKRIRDQIKSKQRVFSLLREMEADVDPYVALSRPEDPFWDTNRRSSVAELRMFSVRQVYPLIIAAYRELNEKDFTLLLRTLSIISFRYNVIGNMPTNEQERVYTGVAEKLHAKHITGIDSVLTELKPLYPNDELFRHAFSDKSLRTTQVRNRRIVRYILFKIESHCSHIDYEFDSERYSLEHILPENPGEGWEHISEQDYNQLIYRIGNIILLTATANKDVGNQSFEVKRSVYAQSEFEITKRVAAENAQWDAERIGAQQRWMAQQATSIWRIAQLS